MAKATLRKDGRYAVAKRLHGKQIWGYGKTPQEAEDNLEAKIERFIRSTPNAGELLHDFAKRAWYPSIENLAPLSKKKYEGIYKNHIRGRLGSFPVREIDFAVVQVWVNDMMKAGVGSATVRYSKDLLGQILNLAVDMGSMDRNPSRRVKVPRGAGKR